MRLTRIYTKTGDKGLTSLANGTRLSKDDPRIESYGTVDELNSVLGICLHYLDTLNLKTKEFLHEIIICVQNDLFNLGSDLATPIESRWEKMKIISEIEVSKIEEIIDYLQKNMPSLAEFVLPGGSKLNAYLHLARTVCRRAERLVITLSHISEINPSAIKFLNRLSDFFFVLSRFVQIEQNIPENTWKKDKGLATFNL